MGDFSRDYPGTPGGILSEARPDVAGLSAAEVGLRLKDARVEAGKSQEEAAQFLEVARTTITAIEKGERRVRSPELLRLAAFYGRSIGELLRRSVASGPLALQLRSVLGSASDADSVVDPYSWTLQHLAEDYAELERLLDAPLSKRYPVERSIQGLRLEVAAEDVAMAERNRLGLGDGPIGSLRDTLEQDVGMRIFFLPMPYQLAGMFAYDEVLGACVAINQNHPETRRRLSLAHEYAHFLTNRRQPTVDVESRYQRVPEQERFANAFAPAFLMPASGISRRFNELKAGSSGFRYADLLTLAHYFFVSVESLTRRLEQLRLIPRGSWERFGESGLKTNKGRAALSLVDQRTQADILPTRYFALAVQALRDERITHGQFAKYLRVDLTEARRLASDALGTTERPPLLDEKAIDRPDFPVPKQR